MARDRVLDIPFKRAGGCAGHAYFLTEPQQLGFIYQRCSSRLGMRHQETSLLVPFGLEQ